jgi:hypothetical protein
MDKSIERQIPLGEPVTRQADIRIVVPQPGTLQEVLVSQDRAIPDRRSALYGIASSPMIWWCSVTASYPPLTLSTGDASIQTGIASCAHRALCCEADIHKDFANGSRLAHGLLHVFCTLLRFKATLTVMAR